MPLQKASAFIHGPLGYFSFDCLCVLCKGGGLFIGGGTVTLDSCNIYANQATNVRMLHPFLEKQALLSIAPMDLTVLFVCRSL